MSKVVFPLKDYMDCIIVDRWGKAEKIESNKNKLKEMCKVDFDVIHEKVLNHEFEVS